MFDPQSFLRLTVGRFVAVTVMTGWVQRWTHLRKMTCEPQSTEASLGKAGTQGCLQAHWQGLSSRAVRPVRRLHAQALAWCLCHPRCQMGSPRWVPFGWDIDLFASVGASSLPPSLLPPHQILSVDMRKVRHMGEMPRQPWPKMCGVFKCTTHVVRYVWEIRTHTTLPPCRILHFHVFFSERGERNTQNHIS